MFLNRAFLSTQLPSATAFAVSSLTHRSTTAAASSKRSAAASLMASAHGSLGPNHFCGKPSSYLFFENGRAKR